MDLAGTNFSNLGPSNKLINIHKSWSIEQVPRVSLSLEPKIGEELVVKHKYHNTNQCAIDATQLLLWNYYQGQLLPGPFGQMAKWFLVVVVGICCRTSTVGNFEITHCFNLIIHGVGVSYNIPMLTIDDHTQLVQSSLEIPIWVTVTTELGENNVHRS